MDYAWSIVFFVFEKKVLSLSEIDTQYPKGDRLDHRAVQAIDTITQHLL